MKFQLELGGEANGSFIESKPTLLDGFPLIQRLTLSRSISALSPDRCTVASILAFAPYLSGQQVFAQQFSALTAELSQRLLQPVWTHFSPLHPGNLPIPRGTREVGLMLDDAKPKAFSHLRLVANDGQSGVRYEPNTLIVTTNALDIDAISQSARVHPSRARLAVAVMLAEDLHVSNFVMTKTAAETLQLSNSVIELLNAVSIGIRVEDE